MLRPVVLLLPLGLTMGWEPAAFGAYTWILLGAIALW